MMQPHRKVLHNGRNRGVLCCCMVVLCAQGGGKRSVPLPVAMWNQVKYAKHSRAGIAWQVMCVAHDQLLQAV